MKTPTKPTTQAATCDLNIDQGGNSDLTKEVSDPIRQAVLMVILGRGARGKSFFARYIIDRTHAAGRQIIIADLDRTNASLVEFYGEDVVRPVLANDETLKATVEMLVSQMAKSTRETGSSTSALLDFTGGDAIVNKVAAATRLGAFCKRFGINLVLVHLLGPDIDELKYLADIQSQIAETSTILVLNEGCDLGGRDASTAFKPIVEDPRFRKALKDNHWVWMPKLDCAHLLDGDRMNFVDAMTGATNPPLEFMQQWKIEMWFADMERALAKIPSDWLP